MQTYDNYISNHLGNIHKGDKEDFELMYQYYKKNFLKLLPNKMNALILDLGCGMGHFLYFLKKSGYENYIGVDLSEECINYCLNKNLASKNNLYSSDVTDFLEKSKKQYSTIVMNDLIEHLKKEEIVPTLKLIRKKLNNKGSLIIKVVNSANPITGSSSRYLDFTHTTGFTEESLEQVLAVAGFKNIKIYPQIIWVFNPIINIFGKTLQLIFNNLFRFIFILYGRKSTSIFTKDIIAVAKK